MVVQTSDDGNLTVSTLMLTPGADDDSSHLICRVKNTMLIGAILEDSIRLDVQCKLGTIISFFHGISVFLVNFIVGLSREIYIDR